MSYLVLFVLVFLLFVLVFFSPFSIAITSLGEERANLSAFRTFVRFALVWFCLFSLPLGAWEGLRFVIVALPGLFSYLFCTKCDNDSGCIRCIDIIVTGFTIHMWRSEGHYDDIQMLKPYVPRYCGHAKYKASNQLQLKRAIDTQKTRNKPHRLKFTEGIPISVCRAFSVRSEP